MSEQKSVQAEITIDADAETVWRAISEGEEIKRWFTLDARVTPGVGGAVWMSFGEGMDWESPIEVWEPNRHLRAVDPSPSKLAVDYYIESKGGETVLRIVHSGFAADAWDDELETLNGGWRAFLAILKNYLEQHRGEPRTVAYFRHPVVKLTRAEAFPRMLEALGVPLVGEGERFSGPIFEGIADVSKPPVNFSGALANFGRGFLLIEIEPGREQCRPAVWVSLYGDAAKEAPALQARLQELVTRAFL
ncbi:MAG TPA: SRPBCC domain-containing protein [Thermoanaerobaculia bacterium]|nr:SRPBCC domain-containing protein [Thermoanaerobaculia bacterium]